MRAFNTGDRVDLYYYAESDHVRSIAGKIDDLDAIGVDLVTVTGDLQGFPWTSVQRMIMVEAFAPEDQL